MQKENRTQKNGTQSVNGNGMIGGAQDGKEDRIPEKGKILFVNSFKGGAGKTTLSLMHCISGLFRGENYQDSHFKNVIYMDLDILGTGTCYLFDEERLTEDKSFDKTGSSVRVPLSIGRQEDILHMAYLDPKVKMLAAFGEKHFVSHQTIAVDILERQVTDYIKDAFQKVPETLLVVDCAPGFSELEQKVLGFCYELAVKNDILVEENYVTTLDAAHVRKCIESMNDIDISFGTRKKFRSVHVVINDIQNYVRYVKEVEEAPDAEERIEGMAQGIRSGLDNDRVQLHFWRYSQEMALRSVFTRGQKVENHAEDYLFTKENYRDI